MTNVRIVTYLARSKGDREELKRITDAELSDSHFPARVKVVVRETTDDLTVTSIEPIDETWDWGKEFDTFRTNEEFASAKLE